MIRNSVQSFCETKRIQIDVKKLYQEYLLKSNLIRNISKKTIMKIFIDENQTKFKTLFNKYIEMNEELDARWNAQKSYLEDINLIAERRSRPEKAEKDFKSREKKQNRLISRSMNLTTQIRQTDFELLSYWLQFNNYLSPFHPYFNTANRYYKKLIPFRINLLQNNNNLSFNSQLSTIQQTKPNLIDQLIVSQNYFIHNVMSNIQDLEIEHSQQFCFNDKVMITLCRNNEIAKECQKQQIEILQKQITDCQIFITPDELLNYYEANRVELVGEVDGVLYRRAYSFNTLTHISERYFSNPLQYMIVTIIQ